MPGLYRSDFGNARHVNALAKRHRPYCLSRPRAGPSSLALGVKRAPLRIRGDGAPGGAAVIVKDPHLLAKMRKRLPARHPSTFQCPGSFAAVWFRFDTVVNGTAAPGRALRGPSDRGVTPNPTATPSASSWRAARIGRRAEPRHRPGAWEERSSPARGRRILLHHQTPLDDAPRLSRTKI